MSKCIVIPSDAFGFPPATPIHQQPYLRHQRLDPELPPQDHHSQKDSPSPHQLHLQRASSTQDLPGRQLHNIPFIKHPKLDLWSQRLGGKTVEKFEELECNFAEQKTIEDIVNWNRYLWEQLKDEKLVDEYNAWSYEYFEPQPNGDNISGTIDLVSSQIFELIFAMPTGILAVSVLILWPQ